MLFKYCDEAFWKSEFDFFKVWKIEPQTMFLTVKMLKSLFENVNMLA